jgi:hypothetical protein
MMSPDHIARLQVLMIDRVVLSNERERRLVVKVRSLASHRLVRFGKESDGLASAITPLLAARVPPLGSFKRALCLAIRAGGADARPIREGSKGLYPKVYAGFLSIRRQGLRWRIGAQKADIQLSASGMVHSTLLCLIAVKSVVWRGQAAEAPWLAAG